MFKTKEFIKATKGKLICGSKKSFRTISTNSKISKNGSFFIPLVGKKYDGHDFVEEAFKNGAAGTLTSKRLKPKKGKVIIKVKDTEKALQALALHHRKKFKIPITGITGSSGKTTTKDMLASILNQEVKTLKNIENYNNEIGVPLTLLKLDKCHRAAVIEMAMQGLGEILELAEITLPHFAIITNIGEAHIMQLKSKKKISRAKAELLRVLKKGDFAILPADDAFFGYLKKKAKPAKVISFGLKKKANIYASDIQKLDHQIAFTVNYNSKQFRVTLPLPGLHNIYNALASSAVALKMGVKPYSIRKGLLKFKPSSKRMEVIERKDGIRIINDTYNANPSSMRAALEVLQDQGPVINRTPPRRIAILGDMLELGNKEKMYHERTGKIAALLGTDILVSVGKLGTWIAKGAKEHGLKRIYSFKNNKAAIQKIKQIIRPNDVILAKASRGMRLEEIIEAILS